jgi:hypothetical protein
MYLFTCLDYKPARSGKVDLLVIVEKFEEIIEIPRMRIGMM